MTTKILIVDDDIDDIDIFTSGVKDFDPDIKCFSAQNGIDGIELLHKHYQDPPDYIFVDLNMPKMNGKEFIKKLRQDDAFDSIKIIIYSTSNLREDEVETRS